MAMLQIFQPAGGGALTAEAVKDLRAATDFALMGLFQSAWRQHFPRSERAGCALNYLDDRRILTQSRDTLLRHIDMLLRHLESLGLCVNMQKSILIPSQSITYLGVCFDSVEMRVSLSQERSATILSCTPDFGVPRQGFEDLH